MASLPTVIPRYSGQDIRLIEAARSGEPSQLQRLLNEGVDLSDAGANGVSALIMASSAGKLEAVGLLLSSGADSSKKTDLATMHTMRRCSTKTFAEPRSRPIGK